MNLLSLLKLTNWHLVMSVSARFTISCLFFVLILGKLVRLFYIRLLFLLFTMLLKKKTGFDLRRCLQYLLKDTVTCSALF